jgi:diguanylate cyclase (GGDEF)-like protein
VSTTELHTHATEALDAPPSSAFPAVSSVAAVPVLRPARGRAGAAAVWLLSAGLASAGAIIVGLTPSPPAGATQLLVGVGLTLAFAAAESFIVNLPLGRHTQSFSVSEIPLVIGLSLAAGPVLVAARVVGSGLALLRWRQSPAKLVFNLGQLVAQTATAVAVWSVLGGAAGGPASWYAALVAVAAADIVGALAVTGVIRIVEGHLERHALVDAVASGVVPEFLNACFGLLAVTVIQADWRAGWMLVVFVGVLVLLNRSHLALRRRHDALENFNRFTRSVAAPLDVQAVATAALRELREQLRCEVAEIVLLEGDGPPQRWLATDTPSSASLMTVIPADADGALLVTPGVGDAHAQALEGLGYRDAMIAPLVHDEVPTGAVAVANRMGDGETFTREHLALLEALGNHVSVALSNARLADQLRIHAAQSEYEALHDSLTGLPNRRHLHEALSAAASPALLLIDLDGFKDINDTLGHPTGDRLLCLVAARLLEHAGDALCVARLGGDEFAVALTTTTAASAVARARVLREALAAPYTLSGMAIAIEASVGVDCADGPVDAFTLLQHADTAMYAAKEARTGVELFTPTGDDSGAERLVLLSELREALRNGELTVHYQPKIDLASGAVSAVEALVRWNHPVRGFVSPAEFIPVAERTDVIHPLTRAVIAQALEDCRDWLRAGTPLQVAVNLSARCLLDDSFPQTLSRLLRAARIPAPMLTLELTESAVMSDPDRMISMLHRLKALGVDLAVDDLGTGYSSLSYLKRLPIDEIKIDRSFVMAMEDNHDDAAIVEAIVALGHRLSKRVVAEGVETAAAYRSLHAMGCDEAQGFYMSRPVPPDAIPGFVHNWRPAVGA